MPPLADSVSIGSSSSTTVSPSFSSFQFRTIGKTPDLFKRISAPEPNQDYQDDSTPTPTPSHSPALEHNQVTSSKLSLFQKLTNGNGSETNTVSHTAPSDLNPGTSTVKASSAFDPVFAALFSANMPMVQPPSIPAMGRRPRSPSDMDMSSAGTTPRIARSLSITQPAPADGAVGLIADNTRFTSADLMNGLELAYPATEHCLSASQEPFDSHRRLSIDADTTPDQEVFTRPNNVIAYLESKSLQQSKVFTAIASLERDFQLVASKASLALENANRAEAVAEKSLSIAKDAVAVAQQSAAAANVVNTGVENALAALSHLRQCYADEHDANEHDRANLLCKMTLKRDMESSPSQASSCNTDKEHPGLGSDLLRILSTEAMELVHERDPGAKKRKRSSDKMDPSSACDLTSRPSKEARHERPTLFFDRTVESEAEAAREAWVQEVERRSAVPPDPAQRAAHEEKEKEATNRGRKDLVMEEDNHGQAARSGSTQGQLVNEDDDMSSDKLDAPLVEGSEENGACGNSHSEESLESKETRARWEREVEEHKLKIARFQMQERELQEKKDKQKGVGGMATTVSEQTEQSAPLRTRPPPVFVAAKTLERNAQLIAQPKPGLSDASRKKVVKTRLALEKQKALPAIGPGSSLAPSGAHTIGQQNMSQEAPRSVADTGRLDFQGQGQTGNDGVTGKEQEQGEKGRETDDRVTVANPRGRGTPVIGGSVDAKDTSKLSIGNVTAQKTLVAPTPLKTATSPQRGKTSVPQNSASMAPANSPIHLHPHHPLFAMASQLPASPQVAMGTNDGPFPLNNLFSQRPDQDTRQASLPPIACITEPDQAESDNAIKRPPSSRTPQKRKQGAKKAAKPRQNAQPSSTEPDPYTKAAAFNAPAVLPLTLASNDGFPKSEVISPTLSSFDQRTPAQEAHNSPSTSSVQTVTTLPQQNEHIDNPAPMSVPRPSCQVPSGSEPRSKTPSETVERRLRVESTNALQPLPVNGQVVAAAERVSNPPSKPTLAIPGQTGNTLAFLKTPHGGHREISGSAASSKPLSRSGLVDHNVSGKAPLPTNGQEVAYDPRWEVSASLHATAVDSRLGAPAASINMPTTRSSMSENLPANVSTSLNSSQTPSSNGPSIGVSIQDSNPLRLAINQAETSQQPTYPKPAYPEARPFRSRSRSSPSSSPSPVTNRKRSWNIMERDHWSPGQEVRGRRLGTARMPPPRSRSPTQHLPLSQRLSESTNPHVGRSTDYYWRKGDTYRPDESPPYYPCEDTIDRPRNQSKRLLDRFTPNTDLSHRQGYNESVPPKRPRVAPPRSNSREGRGGALTLQERIS